MAYRRQGCCKGNPAGAAAVDAPMEPEDVPMKRYIRPNTVSACVESPCLSRDEAELRSILEQLTELACARNQLLTDLLAAVNGLTAALLAVNRS